MFFLQKKVQEVPELKAMRIQRMCPKSSTAYFPCCYPVVKAQPWVGMAKSQRDLPPHLQQKGDNHVPPLQLFSLNYFFSEKGQDKSVTAWGWDAHRGASWKDQRGRGALLFSACLRSLGAAELGYDLQLSWRNDSWVHRVGILKDLVSLAGCLLFIRAVRRMWLLEKGETCSCDTDTSQAADEAAAL